MNEKFVKSLYESIVKEDLELYKNLYSSTDNSNNNDEYWSEALDLYNSLDIENKNTLFKIIEQTMIDTISHMLGIIDGSSTLTDCTLEPKLLLDSIDTEGELQDSFLEFIEEMEENKLD